MLVANDSGIVRMPSEVKDEVDRTVEFEIKLANIMLPDEQRKNFTLMYNLRDLNTLQNYISAIDWTRYLKGVMPSELHYYIDEDPVINVNVISFLRQLDQLIKVTPKRVLTNYAIWRYISSWSFQVDDRYNDIQQKFLKVIIGKKIKSPRWKDCSLAAVNQMPHASGALFVRSFFRKEDKKVVLMMVDELRAVFKDMLLKNNWMDNVTRRRAIEKLERMIPLIGYPEFITNNKLLDDYYDRLHIDPNDTYAQTVEKTTMWSLNHQFRKLMKPVLRTKFGTSSSTVNAFYSSMKNAIEFPAAVLQSPLFDRDFPKAMSFGGIGSVIGHEITHGFDEQGSQFNGNGDLQRWWDEKTEKNFAKRIDCFVKEYNSFTYKGTNLHVNGKLTVDENIADNGGVKQAYKAYRNYIAKRGQEEKRLPGLEHLSMDKVFFISYAQTWCGHSRPEALIRDSLIDPHAPVLSRVNGVMINHPQFAKTFDCPPETLMNPPNKCELW